MFRNIRFLKARNENEFVTNKGFTLLEMIVTISIVTLILSLTIYNYKQFNDNLTLSTAGKEMITDIRKMQIYGESGKESTPGNNDFSSPYGVHFDLSDPVNYYSFVDMSDQIPLKVNTSDHIYSDHKYTGDTSCDLVHSECLEKIPLRDAVTMTNICVTPKDGVETCFSAGDVVKSMDITFTRPSPNADIRLFDRDGNRYLGGTIFRTGFIKLKSAQGQTSTVSVDLTGQILLQ